MSAGELVGVLTNVGLFDTALRIAEMYNLSLYPVLEGLATWCVKLSRNDKSIDSSSVWDWLVENDIRGKL